jgi:hypothetical protein
VGKNRLFFFYFFKPYFHILHIHFHCRKKHSVDETATKRVHNYVTIFTDMDSGDVILVEEGRKKDVFKKLYGWLFDKGGLNEAVNKVRSKEVKEMDTLKRTKVYMAKKRK